MDCPWCGSTNSESKSYCGDCGALLNVHCPACGGRSPPDKSFCGDCGGPLAPAAPTSGSDWQAVAHRSKDANAEHRQLTVMFCDLVGSTALSARLDAEELRDVMGAYQSCVAEMIQPFKGVIARYLGDGILAYFGWPEAHEDDAEQAVRAGLALVKAVADLRTEHNVDLQVRIGIATGMVLVGEGNAQGPAVYGETLNLASRLQEVAEPGVVVICTSTRRLTGGHFHYKDLHPVPLKGFPEPVPSSQIIGTSGVEGRFEARHNSKLAPLVGRNEEIELLLRRWRLAAQGQGRVVVLTGEPGIGKSHIALSLKAWIQDQPHVILRYFCSTHHVNSALFPFINQLERAARFDRDDSASVKLGKLEGLFSAAATNGADHPVALVANLLSLPVSDHYPLPKANPQALKEKTFEVLLAELKQLAARQPVLMIFEDIQWIDPTSLELLAQIVECVMQLRVLVVITARAEFVPPWPAHAHVTTMPLTRLSRTEGTKLVEQVTAGKALPLEVMNQILLRTDGVPLFIEELTKTVLESRLVQERDEHFVLDQPQPSLAIPTTLHASLIARLDRLAPVKEVAQIGAAVGREFSYELLSTVAGLSKQKLDDALDQLVRSELVFCRGELPKAIYTFKHALVRDAAYAGLLKTRRAELHTAIARALEHQFPELVQSVPETLAYHFAEAGQTDKAADYWLRAGKNAASRSANLEAVAHLQRGVEAAGSLPDDQTRNRLELDLQFALGPCLIAIQGPASNEAAMTFGRARELCARLGDPPEYLDVMFWLTTARVVRGELPKALEEIGIFLDLAESRGDRAILLNGMRGHAMILLFMGHFEEARSVAERAVEEFNASNEAERLAARVAGQDAGAAGLALLSWALWVLGNVDEAAAKIALAVQRANDVEHPHTQAYVYYYASVLHALRGESKIALGYAEQCLALSEEHGFRHWGGLSRAVRGICVSVLNPSANAFEEVMGALSEYQDAGYQLGITALYVLFCPALLLSGQYQAALDVVDRGLSTAKHNAERIFEAELYRQKAQALLARAAPDAESEAQSTLEHAITTARNQGAGSLELRAARDLAALWLEKGSRDEARGLLEPMIDGFTESVDSKDLADAKTLLNHLQ